MESGWVQGQRLVEPDNYDDAVDDADDNADDVDDNAMIMTIIIIINLNGCEANLIVLCNDSEISFIITITIINDAP